MCWSEGEKEGGGEQDRGRGEDGCEGGWIILDGAVFRKSAVLRTH
jgi:hypothetical protein